MSNSNKAQAGKTAGTSAAPETKSTTAAPGTTVTENAPVASTEAPNIVPTVPAAPAVAKTRLFWQKACNNIKESTNTEIKAGEVFGATDKKVFIENPKAGQEGEPKAIEVPVYSLKRGKRIYYTPYVTPEQATAAMEANKVKEEAKATAAKAKEEEKAKKAAEKGVKTADGKAVQGAAIDPATISEASLDADGGTK